MEGEGQNENETEHVQGWVVKHPGGDYEAQNHDWPYDNRAEQCGDEMVGATGIEALVGSVAQNFAQYNQQAA
jgi:hypothetical protein